MDDGGPAFPGECGEVENDPRRGMSLRDWFAGQALAGFLAMHADPDCPLPEMPETAGEAYAYADAMLLARKEPAPCK